MDFYIVRDKKKKREEDILQDPRELKTCFYGILKAIMISFITMNELLMVGHMIYIFFN